MKNILHFQIPIKNTKIKDDFDIRAETLGRFLKMIQDKLGENYQVVASPCTPLLLSDDSVLYNFDMKQITLKELAKILEDSQNSPLGENGIGQSYCLGEIGLCCPNAVGEPGDEGVEGIE